jgi:phosphatidate cytidylyltransferase
MSLELKKRIITSFFLFSLLILMFSFSFILIISLIIIASITWIEFYGLILKIYKKDTSKDRLMRLFAKGTSLMYLLLIVLLIITNLESKNYIFFTLMISIFSDMGGLIFGKIFKGRKLTKISPNKTISGAAGSLFFSLLLIPIFFNYLNFSSIYSVIFYTFLISITTQLGDLFISLLKRKADVKNTSDLLPGHGGVLDRIDGIIFAVPMGILLVNIF